MHLFTCVYEALLLARVELTGLVLMSSPIGQSWSRSQLCPLLFAFILGPGVDWGVSEDLMPSPLSFCPGLCCLVYGQIFDLVTIFSNIESWENIFECHGGA
jgi:hypothetical protein